MNYEEKYFVHLIVCAIKDTQPDEPAENIDWKKVYNYAAEQSMFAAFYNSLQKLKNKPDNNVMNNMKKIYAAALNSCIQHDYISNETVNIISNAKIDVLPLKGYYIRNFYRKSEYRYISDLDIFTPNVKETVRLLEKSGYQFIKDDIHHTVLAKNNFPVEIHKTLFVGKYKDIFDNPLKYSFNPESNKYIYNMKDDYFYSFFIAHFAYHFLNKGIGIRSLCDIYLLKRRFKIADKSLIEKCGLKQFEEVISDFTQKVFSGEEYDEDLMDFIFASHTSGNNKNGLIIDVAKQGKSISLFRRIFPTYEYLSTAYNIKNKALLPYYWIKRLNKSLSKKKEKINNFTQQVNVPDEDTQKYKSVLKKLGIKEN
jgi:hypothetical protein